MEVLCGVPLMRSTRRRQGRAAAPIESSRGCQHRCHAGDRPSRAPHRQLDNDTAMRFHGVHPQPFVAEQDHLCVEILRQPYACSRADLRIHASFVTPSGRTSSTGESPVFSFTSRSGTDLCRLLAPLASARPSEKLRWTSRLRLPIPSLPVSRLPCRHWECAPRAARASGGFGSVATARARDRDRAIRRTASSGQCSRTVRNRLPHQTETRTMVQCSQTRTKCVIAAVRGQQDRRADGRNIPRIKMTRGSPPGASTSR